MLVEVENEVSGMLGNTEIPNPKGFSCSSQLNPSSFFGIHAHNLVEGNMNLFKPAPNRGFLMDTKCFRH